jgi:hypothetical protein
MKMSVLSDTDPKMAAKQIELLRAAGPARRAAIAAAMTSTVIRASRRAIQRMHPEWSELEVNLFWAEVHYGKGLANRVRAYLATQTK